jgi:hypothetical protein
MAKESIRDHVAKQLDQMVKDTKTILGNLKKDERKLGKATADDQLIFQVRLHGNLKNEDGLSISQTSRDPDSLENAIKLACQAFKERTFHHAIQADVAIFVVMPNGTKIKLPKKFWGRIYKKYS